MQSTASSPDGFLVNFVRCCGVAIREVRDEEGAEGERKENNWIWNRERLKDLPHKEEVDVRLL